MPGDTPAPLAPKTSPPASPDVLSGQPASDPHADTQAFDLAGDAGEPDPTREIPRAVDGLSGLQPTPAPRSAKTVVGAAASPAAPASKAKQIGGYRPVRLIGKGGMAHVFLAEDTALGRQVALKVMKPDLDDGMKGCERFLREARIMAAAKHEHLVTVYQVGQQDNLVWLAMELLHGETLQQRLKRDGRLSGPELLRIGREIALGLTAIHGRGLVHRDIKPANLWLEAPNDRVKLLDFGLARLIEDDSGYTQTGTIVGTPGYMSPEQARGEAIDFRSDLFSLGAVMYQMAAGEAPFEASNTMAVLTKPTPIRQRNPELPPGAADLIDHLLAKERDQRPSSADEVVRAIKRIEAGCASAATPGPTKMPAKLKAAVARAAQKKPAARRQAQPEDETLLAKAWATPARRGLLIGAALALLIGLGVMLGLGVAGLARGKSPGVAGLGPVPETPSSAGPPTRGPTGAPTSVAAQGEAVYLADLQPIESRDWLKRPPLPPADHRPGRRDERGPPGRPNRDRPPPPPEEFGPDGPPGGGRPPPGEGPSGLMAEGDFWGVMIAGKKSPKSLFMHPPVGPDGGVGRVVYSLGGRYRRFQSIASFNDGPPRSFSPLTFRVLGDGKALWTSKPIRTQSDAQPIDVDIAGVDKLTLEVDCPGEPRDAHAVWVEPRAAK